MRTDYKHLFTPYNEEVVSYRLIFETHNILDDIKELSEGKTELSFEVSGIYEVFTFILCWGNKVTIIELYQLKEKVKNYILSNI